MWENEGDIDEAAGVPFPKSRIRTNLVEYTPSKAERLTYRCAHYMFVCMKRTTLVLADGCMRAVRDLARKENRQISEVVNDLLIEGINRRRSKARAPKFKLPAFHMGRPKVNLGDRNALEALMDS